MTLETASPGIDGRAERRPLSEGQRRLEREFDSQVQRAVIDSIWSEEETRLRGARVTHYVPLLVERATRARLRELCAALGQPPFRRRGPETR